MFVGLCFYSLVTSAQEEYVNCALKGLVFWGGLAPLIALKFVPQHHYCYGLLGSFLVSRLSWSYIVFFIIKTK